MCPAARDAGVIYVLCVLRMCITIDSLFIFYIVMSNCCVHWTLCSIHRAQSSLAVRHRERGFVGKIWTQVWKFKLWHTTVVF